MLGTSQEHILSPFLSLCLFNVTYKWLSIWASHCENYLYIYIHIYTTSPLTEANTKQTSGGTQND